MAMLSNVPCSGIYPLLNAVCDNNYTRAEWLLRQGANANLGDVCGAEPPLLAAVRLKNHRLVALLMFWNADPNARSQFTGESALTLAASLIDTTSLKMMLEGPIAKPGRYECIICSAYFSSKSKLARHAVVHTGRRDFKCSCGKVYSQRATLTKHRRKHKCI